jgi:hypothetical protein
MYVIVLLLGTSSVRAEDRPAPTNIVAFVGKLINIEERKSDCAVEQNQAADDDEEGKELRCIAFDSLWRARYEVVEVLSGVPREQVLAFDVADHYGFPQFARYHHALLFVAQDPDGDYLLKYQGFEVFPTSTGAWASCGDPDAERTGEPSRAMRPLTFPQAHADVALFSAAGIARDYPSDMYRVEGHLVYCTHGVLLRDLYEQVRTGVLAARGMTLPPLD